VRENGTPIVSGNVFLAEAYEGFTYDADGNLTRDGRFTYAWDGENQLIKVETRDDLASAAPRIKLEFTYDYMGRRASKKVYEWDSSWELGYERRFHWMGWTLIAESNSLSNVVRSYLWGLDLSEQRQPQNVTPHYGTFSSAAGGVGGWF
jgi:hypothetical protein